jgi:hypothetical protein
VHGPVVKNYYNKRAKSQIFVDATQEGVNHGITYVMLLNACGYLLSSIDIVMINE